MANKDMKSITAMAMRYKRHISFGDYIPLQDIVRYERAYKLVYGKV